MTPALTASIRAALDKPLLSEEACRRVAVAVLEGVRESSDAMDDSVDDFDINWGYLADGRPFTPGQVFAAMIDAALSEIRG